MISCDNNGDSSNPGGNQNNNPSLAGTKWIYSWGDFGKEYGTIINFTSSTVGVMYVNYPGSSTNPTNFSYTQSGNNIAFTSPENGTVVLTGTIFGNQLHLYTDDGTVVFIKV